MTYPTAQSNAIELVLALHDHKEANVPGFTVHLDPEAEKQLRAALTENTLVDQLRRLQHAANGMNYHEFCDAMGWPRDDYTKAKFTALQEVGRILGNCDDHTLSAPVTAYEMREARYAAERRAVEQKLEATGHSRPADAPMQDANIPLQPYAMERGRERHTKGGPA